MDIIIQAAKDYVLDIAQNDCLAGGVNSEVATHITYPGIESAFIAGAKYICELIGTIHYLPEDLYENKEGNQIDDMTVLSMSQSYTLILKSGTKISARRIWEKDNPIWSWKSHSSYIKDEDVAFWVNDC